MSDNNAELPEGCEELMDFTACDVADVLLKLKVPGAGFLVDLVPQNDQMDPTIARASTFLFAPKASASFPNVAPPPADLPASNADHKTQFSDLTKPGTFVVIQQPAGQSCACLGGHHAKRMQILGAVGILVDGRIRDMDEMQTLSEEHGFPVWSKGKSVVGAGAQTQFHALEVPLQIGDTRVEPGDIIYIHPKERGAVCVPKRLVARVLKMLSQNQEREENVSKAIGEGMTVTKAFQKYRR